MRIFNVASGSRPSLLSLAKLINNESSVPLFPSLLSVGICIAVAQSARAWKEYFTGRMCFVRRGYDSVDDCGSHLLCGTGRLAELSTACCLAEINKPQLNELK